MRNVLALVGGIAASVVLYVWLVPQAVPVPDRFVRGYPDVGTVFYGTSAMVVAGLDSTDYEDLHIALRDSTRVNLRIVSDTVFGVYAEALDSLPVIVEGQALAAREYDRLQEWMGRHPGEAGVYYLSTPTSPRPAATLRERYLTWSAVKAVLWPIGLFGMMLAGVLAKHLLEELKRLEKKGIRHIDIARAIKRAWSATRFWMTLIVAPVVFFSVYPALSALPQAWPAIIWLRFRMDSSGMPF